MQAVQKIESTWHDASASPWVVLAVDDEPEVLQVTRLVLANLAFEGRRLELLSANSAAEAAVILQQRDDVAVMLLDVVMETPHAGLDLVRQVRQELGNRMVRIVLRTGQPGEAPEHEVVAAYDINDYREKTELTSTRLIATLYAALRSYRDMRTIEAHRQGLENVIGASACIFTRQSRKDFVDAALLQLAGLLPTGGEVLCCELDPKSGLAVLAGTEAFKGRAGSDPARFLPPEATRAVRAACQTGSSQFGDRCCVLLMAAPESTRQLVFVCLAEQLSELEQQLLRLFGTNADIAGENMQLGKELVDSQLEMVYLLASTAETRSRETASHVHRVGLLAEMLGRELGLDKNYCELLRLAAPLHDIGKVAIPDSILNKPGPHNDEEATVMRSHAEIGSRLLSNSRRPVMQLAAEIALNHHENYDGSGYPNGLAGKDIPLSGRITMVADVFDALGSRRCYKEPWNATEIRQFLEQQRGKKFDPDVLDRLQANWDEALEMRRQFPD